MEEKQESKRRKHWRELEWVKDGRQRQTCQREAARLNAYDKLQNEEVKRREAQLELFIPPGDRLGDQVIDIKGLTKSYGNRILIENFSASIPKMRSWVSWDRMESANQHF